MNSEIKQSQIFDSFVQTLMYKLHMPLYNPSRHPMETWQEWYLANQTDINREAEQSNATDIYDPQAHEALEFEIRMIAPYEYTDSLNQRQIWEPFLTGRERQEFDSHLRTFMAQSRSARLRLRPAPVTPSESNMNSLQFRVLPAASSNSSALSRTSSKRAASSSSASSTSRVAKRASTTIITTTTNSSSSIPDPHGYSSSTSSPRTPKLRQRSSSTTTASSPKPPPPAPAAAAATGTQYQNYSAARQGTYQTMSPQNQPMSSSTSSVPSPNSSSSYMYPPQQQFQSLMGTNNSNYQQFAAQQQHRNGGVAVVGAGQAGVQQYQSNDPNAVSSSVGTGAGGTTFMYTNSASMSSPSTTVLPFSYYPPQTSQYEQR